MCEGRSIREVAERLGYGSSMAKRQALRQRLLQALDRLAEEFRLVNVRGRLRQDGERPTDTAADVVIHRRRGPPETP